MQQRLVLEKQRFAAAKQSLDLLSPYQVLSRGYAIVQRNDQVITSPGQLSLGDKLRIRLKDGDIFAGVLDDAE